MALGLFFRSRQTNLPVNGRFWQVFMTGGDPSDVARATLDEVVSKVDGIVFFDAPTVQELKGSIADKLRQSGFTDVVNTQGEVAGNRNAVRVSILHLFIASG
jgi:hypothetical protein